MVLLFLLLLVSGVSMVPPRRLTSFHNHQFALVPACTFVAALPGVPIRWFAYFAALAVAPQIAMFSYHINGTSAHLGWDTGLARAILPILIIIAVVTASTATAWLRQVIQKGIGTLIGNANKTSELIN